MNVIAQPTGALRRVEMERAVAQHDPGYDGLFFAAIRTTGIYCRPSCRPPRSPRPENIEFFATREECVEAGYRPCRLCRPESPNLQPPPWLDPLLAAIKANPDRRWDRRALEEMRLSPDRVRRWLKTYHGTTLARWARAQKLALAAGVLKDGGLVDDAVFASGFESHSGFRDAFERAYGLTPRHGARAVELCYTLIETPVGVMAGAATADGVCLCSFTDRGSLRKTLDAIRRKAGAQPVPRDNAHLNQLRLELDEYFRGERRQFSVSLAPIGTPFQMRVWDQLRQIPYAETWSYEELATGIGQPTACRAVAQANGINRIAILIPCHRVVGKDGTLTGYGGGLWRKRLLLELERSGRFPGL
jgi:AraC family transcriptional regulator of adaptative response/methylated-DNA-[protein]-cysteine methyltransferase